MPSQVIISAQQRADTQKTMTLNQSGLKAVLLLLLLLYTCLVEDLRSDCI